MSYNSKYKGSEVEALLDRVETLVVPDISGLATKEELEKKQDAIYDLASIREGASKGATALQSVPSEYVTETELTNKGYATTSVLNNKVDKVSGKQLSTEDFTSVLKTKLEGLSNYDDTELSEALSTLRGDFDKLVSGDTTTAIKTFNEVIAFLDGIQDSQDLSSIIASIEQQIAGKMDKVTLATVATSGSYNDLSNKPTIPSAVTESTISGWGFTKNTGTYSKPSTGIPATDLASSVQTSLGKADTALQSYTEKYTGTYTKPSTGIPKTDLASAVQTSLGKADTALQSYTETDPVFKASAAAGITSSDISNWNGKTSNVGTITGIKMNGVSKGTSGVVDLGTIITAHQDISGKQDKLVSGTNIKTINGTSILGSGDIAISGGSGTITGVSANGTSIATSGVANIPAASTSAYGVTKLSSATNSTSTALAATASAVKAAYDLANNYKGTVTSVKVNGSSKSPSSGVVDIGNVVTSIKINGSTKTPSSGVVDLGTITGGSSSGGSSVDAEIIDSLATIYSLENGKTYIAANTLQDVVIQLPTEKYASCRLIVGSLTLSGAGIGSLSFPASVIWQNDSPPVFEEGATSGTLEMSFFNIPIGYGEIRTLGLWCYYNRGFNTDPSVEGGGDYE